MPSSRQRTTWLYHPDHHAGDNLFAEIALRLAHFHEAGCQQRRLLLRLTFAVFFIAPETEAVLLTSSVGINRARRWHRDNLSASAAEAYAAITAWA